MEVLIILARLRHKSHNNQTQPRLYCSLIVNSDNDRLQVGGKMTFVVKGSP